MNASKAKPSSNHAQPQPQTPCVGRDAFHCVRGWGRVLPTLCLVCLLLFLLTDRYYQLGFRAYHHDESIHSYYSWGIQENGPQTYRYDPVYHGPLQYHLAALFMRILGDSDTTARLPFATFGILMVLVFLLWRRYLGWGGVFLLCAFLALSTNLTYFARFAREDAYMLAWLAGMTVFGGLYLWTQHLRYLSAGVVCLVLAYCTKESSYINSFLPCSFLILWGLIRIFRRGWQAWCNLVQAYLPLLRIMILFGAFSLFVFTYVALDVRVSPETGLVKGFTNIITHSTAISQKTSGAVFVRESGYFSKPEREGVRQAYVYLAFGMTLLVLLALESHAVFLKTRQLGIRIYSMVILGLFYLLFTHRLLAWVSWTQQPLTTTFWKSLLLKIVLDLLLLGFVATLLVVPALIRKFTNQLIVSETKSAISTMKETVLGLYALIFQVLIAVALFMVLFSSLGTNLRAGPRDGLYAYLSYWFKHQTGDFRIWGPWWYYVPRLLLLELLPLCLLVWVTYRWVREKRPWQWVMAKAFLNKQGNRGRSHPTRIQPVDPNSSEVESPESGCLSSSFWQPVATPLRWFAIYQGVFLFGIYSILNEKVPWLGTYPAYGFNFAAAILTSHWLATHPHPQGAILGRILDLFDPRVTLSYLNMGLRILTLGVICFLILFGVGQHVTQIFVRSDYPSELLVYTATTPKFAREIRKIQSLQEAAGGKLTIAVDGKSEWPCVWYFRNYPVTWKTVDLAKDIQIIEDTPETRRRMQPRRGKVWNLEPCYLRAWWIWHGTPDAMPGKLELLPNVRAFLKNSPNDHRMKFPEEERPAQVEYAGGFRDQILAYAFRRKLWYPVGGEKVLICYRTDEDVPAQALQGYLEGSETPPRSLRPERTIANRGAGPAQFSEPRGVCLTPEGNLAVADSKNARIQVLSPTGEFRLEIGKGLLSPEYSGPSDVACDGYGNYFVTDTWNHTLRKFSPLGQLLRSSNRWNPPNQPEAGYFGPRGIVVNSKGQVLVTDTGNKVVRILDNDLNPRSTLGSPGEGNGQFNEPVGIAVDAQDRIYVADTGNGRIQRFSPEGQYEKEWQTFLPQPEEIIQVEPYLDVLEDGRLVLTLAPTGTFWVIQPEQMTATVYRVQYPNFLQPGGITRDGKGGVWITSKGGAGLANLRLP